VALLNIKFFYVGIPQNLTSRKRELQFNGNTQTWSYECVRPPENELRNSSPSLLIPFIEGDKEVSTLCVSLECTTVPSSDSIVAPFVQAWLKFLFAYLLDKKLGLRDTEVSIMIWIWDMQEWWKQGPAQPNLEVSICMYFG
jgi:hypothetical protein